MPFIRVSYQEDQYTPTELPLISKVIMEALIEHFNVPEDDCFQAFHAHKPYEFYYNRNYLNVERSDRLLYIQITLKSGRSTAQKTGFYKSLAEHLANIVNVRQDDVFAVLVNTEFEDWTFGNGIAQMIQASENGKEGGLE
ncbi:putative tautomerase YusQ [Paenibacillus albidus]|uniref:Tautomerase YusQ n=1 Tax=Paenibacillus albidus TaxID=2041023 RepID=A0A917CFK2_9BACL|nr:tautomerase family protein [Paenibacillus albidus]GGF86415.1 putative tautomerase YusQ [Paenibacillus albidus]